MVDLAVDEIDQDAIRTAQSACVVDNGPEDEIEVRSRPSHRCEHLIGGDDLFASISEFHAQTFELRHVDQLGPTAHGHRGLPVTGLSRVGGPASAIIFSPD